MIKVFKNICTTVEAARLAGVSETSIRVAIKSNRLDAIQIHNGQFLIDEKAIRSYIQKREQQKKRLNHNDKAA